MDFEPTTSASTQFLLEEEMPQVELIGQNLIYFNNNLEKMIA